MRHDHLRHSSGATAIDSSGLGNRKALWDHRKDRAEAAIISRRVYTHLPLESDYIALKDVIPHLPRLSLHRYLQWYGIFRLTKIDQVKPKPLKAYEISCFHMDIVELRCKRRQSLYVGCG